MISVFEQRPDCTLHYHDTYSAYRMGCRCPKARDGYRLYYKQRREGRAPTRLIDATGVQRRIRALWAAGHTSEAIGEQAGYSQYQIQQIASNRSQVNPATMKRINRAYRALADYNGPSDKTRDRALRHGYHPPEAWSATTIDNPDAKPYDWCHAEYVDHVLVQRAYTGTITWGQLNEAERLEVIRHRGDRSVAELTRLLHSSGSIMRRYLDKAEATAGVAA